MSNRNFLLIFIFFISLSSHASVCENFKDYEKTCEIAKRYQALQKEALIESNRLNINIDVARFRDVMARRFINRPDWENFLQSGAPDLDPALVYDPKPITWNNWQIVADNFVDWPAKSKAPISVAHLLRWNKGSLYGTVPNEVEIGKIKTVKNYGANLTASSALSFQEIENLKKVEVLSPETQLKWTYLVCSEKIDKKIEISQTPQECQDIYKTAQKYEASSPFWAQTKKDMDEMQLVSKKNGIWFWYACWPRAKAPETLEEKAAKHCGMVEYPSIESAKREFTILVDLLNHFVTSKQPRWLDPIHFAMIIQQKMVALHPFNRGNGRVSRWAQDYVLMAMGLPPILYPNMDKDLSIASEDLLKVGHQGAEEALDRMTHCLDIYKKAERSDLSKIQLTKCGLLAFKPIRF